MQTRIQTALWAAIGLILQGCAATPAGTAGPRATLYSTDMVNKAASCVATPLPVVKDGAETPVTMTTGGGGWCGVMVNLKGSPYTAGLLIKRAQFGKVHVHTVGDDTRIDYTPERAPVAADSFAVRLIPGDATIVVSVNTTPAVSK